MRVIVYILLIILALSCEQDKVEFDCNYCDEKSVFCIINKDDSNLIADGKSNALIEVCFPTRISSSITSVIFEVPDDAGDFSIEGGTNTITKDLDISKKASVIFKSGFKPGEYKLTAKVTYNNVEYKEFILLKIEPIKGEVLKVDFDKNLNDLKADNFTQFKAKLKINNIDTPVNKVLCKLHGSIKFINTDSIELIRELNQNNELEFYFQTVNEAGSASIQLRFGEFNYDTSFVITPSYPDKIKLISNRDSIGIKDSVKINVHLAKFNQGNFSKNLPLVTKAIQIKDGNIADFSQSLPPVLYTKDNDNNVPSLTFMYLSPLSPIWDKKEDLKIICSIPNTTLSDTITFKIK